MLSQLYIENIAVIYKASIELGQGLNVFTGETGAGKTILINAINAVLGGRTGKDMIRSGEQRALVSAVFTDIPEETAQRIAELGFECEDGQLMVSRELFADGRSNAKVNGHPATVTLLRRTAQLLIDIHGQNDSRELLDSGRHLGFVDSFGETEALLANYRESYEKLCEVRSQLRATQLDDSYKLQRQDLLQYQIDEIAAAELSPGEEEELSAQRNMIRNAEKISNALGAAYLLLNGDDEVSGLLDGLDGLLDNVQYAARFIGEMEEYQTKVSDLRYDMEELSTSVREYLDDAGFDPRRLDAIESRLDTITKLERKYGATIPEVLEYYDKIVEEMDSLVFSEQRAEELKEQEKLLLAEARQSADRLTEARIAAGERFVSMVEAELAYLDMPSVRLSVITQRHELEERGQDGIEFYISANPGEQPRPLSKTASGGELSRIMLAIKNVLADKDDIGSIIFDEVDAGVSGRAAYKIGKKLHEVASCRQVLCVTHLAQVAAFGDRHMYIYKTVEDNRTYTHVSPLERSERIAELARITVGENLTDAALRSAEELLEQAGH